MLNNSRVTAIARIRAASHHPPGGNKRDIYCSCRFFSSNLCIRFNRAVARLFNNYI